VFQVHQTSRGDQILDSNLQGFSDFRVEHDIADGSAGLDLSQMRVRDLHHAGKRRLAIAAVLRQKALASTSVSTGIVPPATSRIAIAWSRASIRAWYSAASKVTVSILISYSRTLP
jgi:hypothetical protein